MNVSLIVATYVPTGIVISGDSRTTGVVPAPGPQPAGQGTPTRIPIVVSDSADKVFLLWSTIGIGTWGDAYIGGLPVAHHLGQFALDKQKPQSVSQAAEDLAAHFGSLIPAPNVHFVVAGYDGAVAWVGDVDVPKKTTKRWNTDAVGAVSYGALWGGESDVVARLLSKAEFAAPYAAMNLQDAVDFSRHLVRSTIDQMRFEPRMQTVGGPIDTLVLSPTNCEFLAHKHLHVRS